MGGRMALAGLDVSLVARGPHLVSMKKDGLRLEGSGGGQTVQVTATDNPAELGPQDFVIISVKAISLSGANIGPLLGPDTAVITAMNGIPGGTIMAWKASARPGHWKALILEVISGDVLGLKGRLGVSLVIQPRCHSQVSSDVFLATVSISENQPAKCLNAVCGWQNC